MSRRGVVLSAVAVLAAAAMVGGPIAAANASNLTIKLALVRATPGLRRSDQRIKVALARYATTHRAGPVIRAVRAQDRDLSALRTKMRRSSASTSTGARAQRDIIKGLGLVLRSNYQVNRDLRRQANVGLSPTQIRRAQRLARRGNVLFRRGVRLLIRA